MARNIATEQIARAILVLRGQRVLLDAELAALYGVAPKVLLQAVKRNRKRFPADFMMQLNAAEWAALRSQSVTSNPQRGGRRYRPYAFTEQGVAMLSTVLRNADGRDHRERTQPSSRVDAVGTGRTLIIASKMTISVSLPRILPMLRYPQK